MPAKSKPEVILKPEVVEESVPTSVVPESSGSSDVWGKYPPVVDGSNNAKPSKALLATVIILVALTVAAIGVVGKQMFSPTTSTPKTVVADETVQPTSTPEPTPSPTPEITSKDKVKIQILNGSGVTGQAGKLATELEKADFVNPVPGNATVSDQVGTIVEYSPKVDVKIVDEVVEVLKETLTTVEAKVNSDLTTYHIVITTGAEAE